MVTMMKTCSVSVALAIGLSGPTLALSIPVERASAALIHGNSSGLGNNASAAAIDALDAACARHDACTPDGALATKACNLRLQRGPEAISRDARLADDLRTMAGVVSVGTSMMMSSREPEASPTVVRSGGRTLLATNRH